MSEEAFTFACSGDRLVGVLHHPAGPTKRFGLLILVGGPQDRVGAHRQYVHLARRAAAAGIAAMRFDYRGIGDSEGSYPGFEAVGPDITAAVAAFHARVPGLDGVVLWGMCEGASAILLAGVTNPSVRGNVLVNPWVRTTSGEAQTYLRHHYGNRLLSRETWARVLRGEVNVARSMGSIMALAWRALRPGRRAAATAPPPYPERMAAGLGAFDGDTLLVMSGRDLVAREFDDVTRAAGPWQRALSRPAVRRVDIAESDHTFSSEAWRTAAADATIAFITEIGERPST